MWSLFRRLNMSKYFKYFDSIILTIYTFQPLLLIPTLDPIKYLIPLNLSEHLFHLVFLDHLNLDSRINLKHPLLRIYAPSLNRAYPCLSLVPLALRAKLSIRERLLKFTLVVHGRDFLLCETMESILEACEKLV